MIEPVQRARRFGDSIAVAKEDSQTSYRALTEASAQIASWLLENKSDLKESRVAFMITPGAGFVATLWGIWMAGGIAVPLCLSYPAPSLAYVLDDTGADVVIASPEFEEILFPLCQQRRIQLIKFQLISSPTLPAFPSIESGRRALILYTSGTTSRPKGVVTTHKNILAQITTLVKAWEWSAADHTVCVLPLHHVHGLINVVSCALWTGAQCHFMDFDALKVLELFMQRRINVFMAVPTVYFKLISAWESLPESKREDASSAMRSFRLMVSGSAALPVSVMTRWEEISGHRLLERYGMTELGMAISNPYRGERRAGFVGTPLDGVSVRLCDEQDAAVSNEPGEIQVRGENVFLEYWNQPEATTKGFTSDGWFRTGDVAVLEKGYYRILGRSSTDIIKSGGFKISALEIEEALRQNEAVKDCAVVGLENEEWGEVIAAAVVPSGKDLVTETLIAWLKSQIPDYRIPRKFLVLNELPRNAMGKVIKGEVKKLFQQ